MASALDDIGIDFDNVDAEALERQMELGGKVPPGLHHAALIGCEGPKTNDNGNTYRELKFHILAGPGKGMDITEKLYASDKPAGKNKQIIFAHRLGLLTKKDGKYAKVPGKVDYTDVIGAECVIEVEHKKAGKEAKNPDAVFANLSFEGVLALDDKRCVNVPKAGSAAAKAAVANAPKTTTNDELKGL